ncbi:sugar ABC transporter substrate-binding protein [Rhizocola hellebori]|uniref:Sugar ABC transporter substrate-binding protein n=1 Tax=Rhizocola hellebori TaxID=1392758 RepID=A0A8J3QA35_9ACTN|nr:extracellular solute-binding protein [Rhizocola hellebori]GIH05948.1 sugar ABC transporter substrate-binding protein [Rhizocola hellebori]
MLRRYRRRAAMVAASVLSLTLALTACSSGEEPQKGEDLSAFRVGAMEKYGVGDQFKATESLKFSTMMLSNAAYPFKDDWLFLKELTKRTNITIDPVVIPGSDYNQKRGVLIGAGDAPFIIPKTYHPDENAFIASGAILPVSDYIDLMPNFKDKVARNKLEPELNQFRAADGKFYLLPGLHEKPWQDYTLAMRTDILQQLNLQMPKTWDEVYTTLKAMKTAYPDSYPLSDRFSKPTPGGNLINLVSIAYGTRGGWGYQPMTYDASTKKFVVTGAMPQYKQMLEFLAKLVKEGLLDPESFTQADDAARQKLANGKSFAISTNAQTLVNEYRPDLAKTIPAAKMSKILLPIGPTGEVNPASRLESGIMISKKARDSKNFVAMMQFIDWLWYSDAGQEFAKWGVEGVTYQKDSSGKFKLTPDVNVVGLNPAGTKHMQKDFGFYNGVFVYGGKPEIVQAFFSAEEQEFQKVMNARKPVAVDPPYPLTDEEREQVTLWETPLKDFVFAQSLRFILGQRPMTEWDAYLTELKGKNTQQFVDLVNKAADRYKTAHPS